MSRRHRAKRPPTVSAAIEADIHIRSAHRQHRFVDISRRVVRHHHRPGAPKIDGSGNHRISLVVLQPRRHRGFAGRRDRPRSGDQTARSATAKSDAAAPSWRRCHGSPREPSWGANRRDTRAWPHIADTEYRRDRSHRRQSPAPTGLRRCSQPAFAGVRPELWADGVPVKSRQAKVVRARVSKRAGATNRDAESSPGGEQHGEDPTNSQCIPETDPVNLFGRLSWAGSQASPRLRTLRCRQHNRRALGDTMVCS